MDLGPFFSERNSARKKKGTCKKGHAKKGTDWTTCRENTWILKIKGGKRVWDGTGKGLMSIVKSCGMVWDKSV